MTNNDTNRIARIEVYFDGHPAGHTYPVSVADLSDGRFAPNGNVLADKIAAEVLAGLRDDGRTADDCRIVIEMADGSEIIGSAR